jgi:hypothetical protein
MIGTHVLLEGLAGSPVSSAGFGCPPKIDPAIQQGGTTTVNKCVMAFVT